MVSLGSQEYFSQIVAHLGTVGRNRKVQEEGSIAGPAERLAYLLGRRLRDMIGASTHAVFVRAGTPI